MLVCLQFGDNDLSPDIYWYADFFHTKIEASCVLLGVVWVLRLDRVQ